MKKILLIALLFISHAGFSQTIRRVNNSKGLNDPNVYKTAQAAQDAAVAGDIIQLEPSDNPNYGGVIFTKKLTMYGTGYHSNNTPNSSFDKRNPYLEDVYFENGSKNSSIMGVLCARIFFKDENITVSRCKTNYVYCEEGWLLNGVTTFGNKLTFTQNFVLGNFYAGGANSCIISNNIFYSSDIAYLDNCIQSVISNNIFRVAYYNRTIGPNVKSSVITNNIFDARDRQQGTEIIDDAAMFNNSNTISNNLCTSINDLPTGSGNVNGVDPALVFKVANPWVDFDESNLQLATNSPAQTVAAGSKPIGPFAGGTPYVLAGVPNIPVITAFTNTGSGSATTPLSVTISVRSSN